MKRILILLPFLAIPTLCPAQDDLMKMLNQKSGTDTLFTAAAFKSTRVMNGHSIKNMPEGQLDFRISHRFGPLNGGLYEFLGLDQSSIHLGLEYGITERLMAGIGHGTNEKTYDAFVKYRILRQSTGARNMPLSVSVLGSAAAFTVKWSEPADMNNPFSSRMSYAVQVLAGRKFSEALSLQLAPVYVHRNFVRLPGDPNDIFALGAGGRIKLAKRISFNAEYYYLMHSRSGMIQKIYDPLSLGFDIETGGHVFQLIFSNSYGMIERDLITETTGRWFRDVHFGFNISRVFTLKK
jgi:hypothetical protein